MIAATIIEITLMRCNQSRAQVSEEDIRAQFTQEELDKQGDKSPLYKYTLWGIAASISVFCFTL